MVGAGIIGLAPVAAVKGHFPSCPVTALDRHQHQTDAVLACRAAHAVLSDANNGHFEGLSQIMGDRHAGMGTDTMLMGGFPFVVEAVGAPRSVTEALCAVAH